MQFHTRPELAVSTPQSSSLPVRIIEPHTGLDAFRDAVRSLWTSFPQARQLAWRFFLRDTRADHRQSLLGYAWLLVPPLANTAIWVFLSDQNVISVDSGAVPYPLFVLSGAVLWGGFNVSVMAMLNAVGDSRALLSKVNFPHEALLYSAFLKALLNTLITAAVLVPAVVIYAPAMAAEMALFPVALLATLLLGTALGLLVLPAAALYGDIGRGAQLVLRFGFFLTPVIFPLPETGMARRLMLFNPATPVIVTGRSWLTGSETAMIAGFVGVAGSCFALIAFGVVIYKVALPHLIERLGG